jgi:DNA repair protein RecO (recombination protein O)
VQLEPAFLLHHYPYRDSSRLVELLTRTHGRVAVFARTSRRGNGPSPATLQPFGELLASWTARGETGQLTGAERRSGGALPAERLLAGFYVNELLVRLLPRNDPHPRLFDAYRQLLESLAQAAVDSHRPLRLFEKRLLEELGYGLYLESDRSGAPLAAEACYRYRLEAGAERLDGVAEGSLIFSGASLRSLAQDELADARSLADARRLLRAALDVVLEGRELRTREVAGAMAARRGARQGG